MCHNSGTTYCCCSLHTFRMSIALSATATTTSSDGTSTTRNGLVCSKHQSMHQSIKHKSTKQQAANVKQQATGNKQQATSNKHQATGSKHQGPEQQAPKPSSTNQEHQRNKHQTKQAKYVCTTQSEPCSVSGVVLLPSITAVRPEKQKEGFCCAVWCCIPTDGRKEEPKDRRQHHNLMHVIRTPLDCLGEQYYSFLPTARCGAQHHRLNCYFFAESEGFCHGSGLQFHDLSGGGWAGCRRDCQLRTPNFPRPGTCLCAVL